MLGMIAGKQQIQTVLKSRRKRHHGSDTKESVRRQRSESERGERNTRRISGNYSKRSVRRRRERQRKHGRSERGRTRKKRKSGTRG
jgi:hypothetical protein